MVPKVVTKVITERIVEYRKEIVQIKRIVRIVHRLVKELIRIAKKIRRSPTRRTSDSSPPYHGRSGDVRGSGCG